MSTLIYFFFLYINFFYILNFVIIAFNPANGGIYITNHGSNTVSVIDNSTSKIQVTLSVGGFPSRIAYNPENGNMYIADWHASSVKVMDSLTHNLTEIKIGSGLPTPLVIIQLIATSM